MDFKKLMSKLDQLNEGKGSHNPDWDDQDHQDHAEQQQEKMDADERASEEDGIPDWGPLLNWSKKNKLKDPTVKEGTQETPTGKIHTADPGGYGRKDDEDDDGKKVKADAPKRGRGRPKKDADNDGEVKKYDWSQFGAKKNVKLPKWDKNKTTKHSLKDWFERIDQAIMEGETQSTGKGLVHKGDYGNSYDGDEAKKAVPAAKRGRGRPKKDADNTGEVPKYDWSQFGGPKPGNKKDVKLPKWDKSKTTKHSIKENAPGQELTVKPMPGAAQLVDPATNKIIATGDAAAIKNFQGAAAQGKVQMAGDKPMGEGFDDSKSMERSVMQKQLERLKSQFNPHYDRLDGPAYYKYKEMAAKIRELENHLKQLGEGKKAKPDFLDKDKDGNKQESFKKAVKDAKKVEEGKDEGKPGKNFAKIADKAAKEYGSKAAGERVAGAVRAKLAKQGKLEEGEFTQHYKPEPEKKGIGSKIAGAAKKVFNKVAPGDDELLDKLAKDSGGKRPVKQGVAEAKKDGLDMFGVPTKLPKNAKPIKRPKDYDEYIKQGVKYGFQDDPNNPKRKSAGMDAKLRRAQMNRGYLEEQDIEEADIPSDQMDMGAGLGAGRSPTTLESRKVSEGAMKDLDYDLKNMPDAQFKKKYGDTKANMRKSLQENKKRVNESVNANAAYLEGKAHGLRGQQHRGKHYEDMEEARQYHEGYKAGLDECYGQVGMMDEETGGPSTPVKTVDMMASYGANTPEMDEGWKGAGLGAAAGAALGGPIGAGLGAIAGDKIGDEMDEGWKGAGLGGAAGAALGGPIGAGLGAIAGDKIGDEMDEGNAFTAKLRSTPSGSKFKLGSKTFTDRSSLDEFAQFESWDRQLNSLLNESNVAEGMTVSISKGQQGAPDSVSVSAQDNEAEQLLQIIKKAGLGLFGGDEPEHVDSSAMSVQADGDPIEIGASAPEIDVVDDHDGMLSLIKKMTGGSDEGSDGDYADEEHSETCHSCGMTECGCNEQEMVDEVESEDQMTYQVAEQDPQQAGEEQEQETTADENAEAQTDQALATADAGQDAEEGTEDTAEENDEEKVDESYANSTDDAYNAEMEYILNAITGGLNKKKATGQTTIPVVAGQGQRVGANESKDSVADWKKLAGI